MPLEEVSVKEPFPNSSCGTSILNDDQEVYDVYKIWNQGFIVHSFKKFSIKVK